MRRLHRAVAAAVLSCAGFSTAETASVVAAASILAATAAPKIEDYLASARIVKATGDTRVIALSMVRLSAHVGRIRGAGNVAPELLISDGEAPKAADRATEPWTAPAKDRAVQPLASHLIDNAAGYPTGRDEVLRWRGPYVDKLTPDPWGWRYAVNVGLLPDGEYLVLVVSAGPDGVINTPYRMGGLTRQGDDVIGLIGRGR